MDAATSFLTLANIYDPKKAAQNAAEVAAYGDAIYERKIRNRLLAMKMEDTEKNRSFSDSMESFLKGTPPTGQQQPAQPVNALAAQSSAPTIDYTAAGGTPGGQYILPSEKPTVNALVATQGKKEPTEEQDQTSRLVKALSPGGELYQKNPTAAMAKLQEIQTFQMTQQKAAMEIESKRANEFRSYMDPFIKNALETGNNDLLQASIDASMKSGIPMVMQMAQAYKDANYQVTAKGETKAQPTMNSTIRASLMKQVGSDTLLQETINGIKDGGRLEIIQKNGKVTEIKPVKDPDEGNKTPYQQARDLVKDELKAKGITRDPTEKEIHARLLADQKEVAKAGAQGRGEVKITLDKKGDDDSTSFKTYTPEMKLQAFKDRDLGTYRYPTGMKSMSEKKSFDKEYYQYRVTGKVDAGDVVEKRSQTRALTDLTKREQLIGTFTNRIDATSKVVLDIAAKYKNKNNRLLNIPINKLKESVGSGEYQSLKLALKSLSNEVAKVESGSLGIAEVSEGQARYMEKVHDPNLSIADMVKIIETGKALGKTSMESIKKQRMELKGEISGKGAAPSVPGKSEWIAAAMRANPKTSRKDLEVYYNQKYGSR